MKRTLVLLTLLSAVGMSAPSHADSTYYKGWACNFFKASCGSPQRWEKWEKQEPAIDIGGKPDVAAAPEIDAGQAGLALALLGSIIAMTRERFRNRSR